MEARKTQRSLDTKAHLIPLLERLKKQFLGDGTFGHFTVDGRFDTPGFIATHFVSGGLGCHLERRVQEVAFPFRVSFLELEIADGLKGMKGPTPTNLLR